jgi:cytochrome P450
LLAEYSKPGVEDTIQKNISDQVKTFFLVGHETTASALSWIFYLLGRHPEWQTKIRDEITKVDLEGLDYDKTQSLLIVNAFIKEALRLYPPIWAFTRVVTEQFEVEGHTFAKGTMVALSPFITQRDPRFFESAEKFSPERWLQSEKYPDTKYAYFPFGVGARSCIGQRFAEMQLVLVLAHVLNKVEISLKDQTFPGYRTLISLRPRQSIQLEIRPLSEKTESEASRRA